MKLKYITSPLLFLSASSLFADQFAWVPRQIAEKAATILSAQHRAALFCAPCNDTAPRYVTFKDVKVEKQGDEGEDYFSIRIDGLEIDLACTYILEDEKWRNPAVMLGLVPHEVPSERFSRPSLEPLPQPIH